jgi:serine/threonine protein kinase
LTNATIGHFRVAERLGGGAMAAVYRAYDTELARDVALKVLLPGADQVMRARFRQEARMVSTLVHPNVVRTLQVGQADDVIYIAMELVHGSSLGALLEQHGRLDAGDACRLLAPVALALDFAHQQGIVHRDVKPSNILLKRVDQPSAASVQLSILPYPVVPLLSDFGIARALDAPELTAVGRTIGTPAFMAPEQCAGSDDVDGRADIYALGAVLYRCLVGRPPFSGSTTQILHAHVYDPLLLPESIAAVLPPQAVEIVAQAMMKDPAQRFATAVAMAEAFRAVAGTLPTPDAPLDPGDATVTLASLPVTALPQPSTSRVLVPAALPTPRTTPPASRPTATSSGPAMAPSMTPVTPLNIPAAPFSRAAASTRTTNVVLPRAAAGGRTRPGRWATVALGVLLVALMGVLGAIAANALLPTPGQDPVVQQQTPAAASTPQVVGVIAADAPTREPTPAAEEPALTGGTPAAAEPTPTRPSPTPTLPPPAVPLESAWDDAQAFFEGREWQSALDWLIIVRRIDSDFEREQIDTMLVRTYIGLTSQVSLRGQWELALEYLDQALDLQPENPVLLAMRAATDALATATPESRDSAREQLQGAYRGFAEDLATTGDFCGAAEQMDAAAKILVTTEIVDRQVELAGLCRNLVAQAAIAEVGGSILYSAQEQDTYAIFRLLVGVNAGSTRLVNGAAQPQLSPNGRMLAFYNRQPGSEGLYGADLAAGLGLDGRSVRYSGSVEDSKDGPPSWSPGGDKLAFSSTRFGDGRYRIYITPANDDQQTAELGYGKDPVWHPRQDLIAFNGTDTSGANPGLWLMRSDGSGRMMLTDNGNDQRPAWSPDGRYLVFMSNGRDGNWELYRLDMSTSELVRLTIHSAQDGLPTVSPDGKWVAFMSDRDGYWRLWYMSIDGGNAEPLGTISGQLASWLEHGIQWVQ